MKKRSLTRTFIAIIILLVVFGGGFLLFGGGLSKLSLAGGKPVILELDLDRTMVEDAGGSPLAALAFAGRLTLQDTLAALEAASHDDRVKVLIARVGNGSMGVAMRQDLRDSIIRFRQSGKKAYAFAETFGEFSGGTGNYYLATGFDRIYLQPSGDVGLAGIRVEPEFYKHTLEKLGIGVNGGQRYEYKNAYNVYTEEKMTPPHREALEGVLQSIHRQMMTAIAAARQIEPERMQEVIDNGPYLAMQARDAKLVDELFYRDQVYSRVRKEVGNDARLLYLHSYLRKRGNPYAKGSPVALVYGVGGVQRGKSNENPLTGTTIMGSDTVCAGIRAAAKNDKIKVILFRVNSPGGSYVASDAVLRELARAREKGKKVVVSMGDLAGSGGYIVALAADRVIAQPGTITGSIGVLALKFITPGFWDKLGISHDAAETARNASMWSGLTAYTPEQFAKFNAWLDRVYTEFTDKVATGRKLPKERVLEIAKGRIWSGEDAVKLGLVDELGGFTHAVDVAREMSGIAPGKNVKLIRYPRPTSLLDALTGKSPENSEKTMISTLLQALAPLRPALQIIEQMQRPAGSDVVEMPVTDLGE
jgi:protease-4